MSKKIWNFGRKTLLIMILSMMLCANARAEGEDTGSPEGRQQHREKLNQLRHSATSWAIL